MKLGIMQPYFFPYIGYWQLLNAVDKNKKTLWNAYHKCNEFETVYPVICEVLDSRIENLAEYLEFSIKKVCQYLGIDTKLYLSSKIDKDIMLHG